MVATKYFDWIPVFSPGINWYADEILKGNPFSLARYGEGEWRVVIPAIPVKKQNLYSEWRDEEAQDAMRHTLIEYHRHDRYFPAIWHQRAYAKDGRLNKIKTWLAENDLENIPWHDGRLWRRAVENDRVFAIVNAIRKQPLPLVVVGPDRVRHTMTKRFRMSKFIDIHPTHAYYDHDRIVERVLSFDEPALISFSAGGTANILIHTLFPEIGDRSFMIDFGALWEGLSGKRVRPYQRALTRDRIEKNWEG